MKKEILFAILIGLSLGLIITYGAYRARKSEQEMATQTTDSIASSPGSETESQGNKFLTLFSPEDESIQDNDNVKITGNTTADSFVVIFIGNDENITIADDSGNFSVESKLEKGSNVIAVHAINEDGKSSIEERTVIYTTAAINTENNDDSQEASPSGEAQDE
ncbi:MAG: hypothetical protein ABFQ62_03400 [Patescibacteria group bacterium]